MARYSISYTRPGEPPAEHKLNARSDAEAKIRFLNLPWVQFTEISINSIALAADQPEAAKATAREASRPKGKGKPAGETRRLSTPAQAAPTVAGLSDEIERLQLKRAAALARGDHASAGALNQRINEAKRQRHELLKSGKTT